MGEAYVCTAAGGVAGDGCRGDEEVWLPLPLLGEAGRECFDAWEGYALNTQKT